MKLGDFVNYCQEHPDERFWQALRNWSGYDFILGVKGYEAGDEIEISQHDTFYIED